MNFVSWSFAVLFLVVFVCRLTIGRRKIERSYVGVLLASSLIFYGWHVPSYLLVLLTSSTIDYIAALALVSPSEAARRRRGFILFISMATNLGLLAWFKYANFVLQTARDASAAAGLSTAIPTINVLLPMGISFYTFQSMSYTIDVYRGRLVPLRNYAMFLQYISFFPHLVAGPIVEQLISCPRCRRVRRPQLVVLNEGLFLVAERLLSQDGLRRQHRGVRQHVLA